MVGIAVATTVDSIEARNRLSMIPAVTSMTRLRDIKSFQVFSCQNCALPLYGNLKIKSSSLLKPVCYQSCQRRFANGINIESHLIQLFVIKEIPSIEDKGGLDHGIVNSFIVQLSILRPFCENGNRMSLKRGNIRVDFKCYAVCQ